MGYALPALKEDEMKKKLWGGRFTKPIDPIFEAFSQSVYFDHTLAEFDCIGSILHVLVLRNAKYLSSAEASRLIQGLVKVHGKAVSGMLYHGQEAEDVHTLIQQELAKSAGSLVAKLHTARSRNDQVVLATKLYCRHQTGGMLLCLADLIEAFDAAAEKYQGLVLPGFTHMQHAQPVEAQDYFGAYSAMLQRDYAKLKAVHESIELSFGSGALAGTPIAAQHYRVTLPEPVRKALGVKERISLVPASNALDTVSSRDFVLDILSALAVMGMHFSRFAEDMIIWSSQEFSFVELDDAYCTGSSLMPQKKNPDALELIRGYAGRLQGNLVSVLTMLKGLPLSYNRDMQLDKEPLFESMESSLVMTRILAGVVGSLSLRRDTIARGLEDEGLYATDLAYFLVHKGVAFSRAHETVGRLFRYAADRSLAVKDMEEKVLKTFHPCLTREAVSGIFDAAASVKAKRSLLRR